MSVEVCHDGGAVDVEQLGKIGDRGASHSSLDEVVHLWGCEAGLPLLRSSRTSRGLTAAFGANFGGRKAVTRPFRV